MLARNVSFYTAKYARLIIAYPPLNPWLDFAPQFPLSDPTHVGVSIFM